MSTLRLTTLSNQGGTASVPSDTVINGTAKSWVNFNGTGTVAIRKSFNVSSITDNGTGVYTVNFTTAMPDNNYGVVSGAERVAFSEFVNLYRSANYTTSSFRFEYITGGTVGDSQQIMLAVFC
jgi:hypothetical protein